MMGWAALKIRIDCPECGGAVMVDSPLPSVTCGECHATIPLKDKEGTSLWPWVFHNAFRSKGRQGNFVNENLLDTSAAVPFVYLASHRGSMPQCPACDAWMDLDGVPDGTDGTVPCPSCGAEHPTWPARYADEDGDVTEVQVFLAPPQGSEPGPDEREPPTPVVFACANCGANLKIGAESKRILTCEYCSTDQYLPNDLWNHLHPVRQRRAFMVRRNG